MGIISLVMLIFGFSLPFAAMGIILSLLSREGEKPDPAARSGFIMSLIALIIGLVITASSIFIMRSGVLEDTLFSMRNNLEETYGEDQADDIMDQFEEMLGVTEAPKGGEGQ